jgi:hypothetical protein
VADLQIDIALDVQGVGGELWFRRRRHQQPESYQRPRDLCTLRSARSKSHLAERPRLARPRSIQEAAATFLGSVAGWSRSTPGLGG